LGPSRQWKRSSTGSYPRFRKARRFYKYDEEARAAQLSPQDRLRFHQQHSEPLMTSLQEWLQA
jgi:hypothetical protein